MERSPADDRAVEAATPDFTAGVAALYGWMSVESTRSRSPNDPVNGTRS